MRDNKQAHRPKKKVAFVLIFYLPPLQWAVKNGQAV
jgi:hypothetical protein